MSLLTIFARNAQNQATVAVRDAPGADAAANAGDDIAAQKLGGELSSTPSLSQVVAAGLLDVKAQRAYEVARQRTKRPGDRAKAREQKATSCSCGYCERRNAKAHQRPLAVSVRDLVHGREDADDASEAVAVPAQPARSFAKDDGRREVQLEDLLRVAKVRKEKGTQPYSHVNAVMRC